MSAPEPYRWTFKAQLVLYLTGLYCLVYTAMRTNGERWMVVK